MERVDDLRWRKASYSGNGGASCVEVGQAHDGTIVVRDTKNRGRGPLHHYTPEKWRAFIAGIRNGEFDLHGPGCLP